MTDLRKLLAEATPGPWRIVPDQEGEPAQCITAGGFDVATAWGGYLRAEADARLIALTPQLAAALIKVEEALVMIGHRDEKMIWGEDYEVREAFDDVLKIARATLSDIRALVLD